MALLPILQFPDPKLKLVAKPVEIFGADLEQICYDMLETMYESHGVGLAATQVDIQQRIFVMDLSDNKSQQKILINPVITQSSGEITWEEGCLSFPGIYAKVKRHSKITVEYCNLIGDKQTLEANELMAVCIQHEIDHLNGITFFDHLSSLKQSLIRRKLKKQYERNL